MNPSFISKLKQLEGNEELAETLFNILPVGIDIVDKDGVILFANKFLKKKYQDIIGKKCFEIYSKEKCKCVRCPLNKELSIGDEKIVELSHTFDTRDYQVHHIAIPYKGKTALLEMFEDVTDNNIIEKEAGKKEAFFQILQSVTSATNEVSTVEDAMQKCIESICKHIGWEIGHAYVPHRNGEVKLVSSRLWYISHPKKFRLFKQVSEKIVFHKNEGLPGRVFVQGKPLWVMNVGNDSNFLRAETAKQLGIKSAFAFPVLEGKEVVAVMEFFTDKEEFPDKDILNFLSYLMIQMGRVTERKRFYENFSMLAQGVESAGESFVMTDQDGKVEYINLAFTQLTGYTLEDIQGKTLSIIKSNFHPAEFYQNFWNVITHGETWSGEIVNKKKNGELYTAYIVISPVFDKEKNYIKGFVAIQSDITEQNKVKKELAENEAFLNQLFQSTADGVWVISREKETIRCNNGMAYILGEKSPEDIVGKKIFDFVDEKGQKIFMEMTKKSQEGFGQLYEIELLQKNGEKVSCLFSTAPFRNAAGEIIGSFAFVKDINDHKRSLSQLEEQFVFLNSLLDTIPNAIFYKDKNGVYRGCNQAFSSFIGKDKNDIIGKTLFEIYPKEFAEKYEEMDRELIRKKQKIQTYEAKAQRADGEIRNVMIYKTLYHDIHGEINGVLGIAVDVTEQKLAQEKLSRSNEKLRELDRLKDEFISIASHELRTPMTVIDTYAAMLMNENFGHLAEKQLDFVQRIASSTKYLMKLVNDLLDISKLEIDKMNFVFQDVDICVFMEHFVKDFLPIFEKKHIRFSFHNCAKNCFVYSDREKLKQILNNLVGNAFKFTPEGGEVEISFGSYEEDPTKLLFCIKDTGIGISKEKHELIFDKFTQAHASLQRNYDGTGLGLAIVKSLVEKMGGKIWVKSSPNKGATFCFTLPKEKQL